MILGFETDREFQKELDRVDGFLRKDGEPLYSIVSNSMTLAAPGAMRWYCYATID